MLKQRFILMSEAGAEGTDAGIDSSGGLPSAATNIDEVKGKFTLPDEVLQSQIKDGKLYGRFDTIQDVLNTLKAVEDKHANFVRETKNTAKQTAEEAEASRIAQEAAQKQQETARALVPKLFESGMQITPEVEAAAKEAGIDIRDLKLGAIELKERISSAHSIVGGEENYRAMIAWGMENMTDAQKKSFDADILGSMSEYAIKGLYSDYMSANGKQNGAVQQHRVAGNVAPQGVRPYANQEEMLKDRNYVNRNQHDVAALKAHRARLAVTPDEVIYGR